MQEETTNEAAAPPLAPASELARPVAEALASGLTGHVRSLVQALEAPEHADLIELLEPAQRVQLVEALGPAFNPEVLSQLDETVRDHLLPALPKDVLAKALAELEADDAAYLLEHTADPARAGIAAPTPS